MGKNRILQHAIHAALAAAAASAVVPAAYAQTTPAAAPAGGASELQEVVVTGTRIQSANLISASPVTTITNTDIQASGLTRVEDLLNNLPQVFAGQGANMSNGSTGTATVDLHDLGANRTLVLVDGMRLAPGVPGGSSAADVNMIPAELIERVEVLTGGASSTYGADAVSGVVNFIMNTHYEGVKFDTQFGDYNHNNHESLYQGLETAAGQPAPSGTVNSGQQKNFSFVAGSNFAEGAGNATVYATYDKAASNLGSQFDYSACSLGSVAGKAACAGSATDAGGNFIAYGSKGRILANTVDPKTGLFRPAVASDDFNFGALNFFQRPTERWTAGFFLHYDVNEHTDVYSEFMFMRNNTTGGEAPGGDFANNGLSLNCGAVGVGLPGNPLITAQERSVLCNPAQSGPAGLLALQGQPPGGSLSYYLQRRNVEGGQRLTDDTFDDFRQVIGVKGDFLDAWKYNAYAQVGITDSSVLDLNNFSVTRLAFAENPVAGPNGTAICAANAVKGVTGAPGCVPYNPWVPGGVTPAQLAYLQVPALETGTDREYVLHADLTGDLGKYGVQTPWAKTGLQVNLGTEYRSESTTFNPDEENISDDIAGGAGAVLPIAGNFHVWEVFTEFNMPILDGVPFAEQLSINGGYRYSKYTLGFSTNTYKFGVEYAPIKDVRFRASFNQAVRAPNIGELFAAQTVGPGGSIDPCWGPAPALTAAQCARTGVTAAQYGNLGVNPASQFNIQTGGNPALSPEKAHTWSYGVVFQPTFLPNFSATVDYYDIRITGAIEAQNGVSVIDNCALTGNPSECGLIHRDVNGSLFLTNAGFVTTLSQNTGLLEDKGVDINLHYTYNMDSFGKLVFNLQGTDTIANTTQPNTSVPDPVSGALLPGPSANCAGFEGVSCGSPLPHWRHIFSTDWSTPWQGFDLHAQWRFIGATQVDALSQSVLLSSPGTVYPGYDHIPTFSYLDLSASVAINSNLSIRVGANNVLDKDPPVILSGNCPVGACNNNTWVQTYDPTGRFLYVHLTAKF
jgi:iron complex outermembrane recepter protein